VDAGASAVFEFRARPGREHPLDLWLGRVVSEARDHGGTIAVTVEWPGASREYRVVQLFRDAAARESWLASPRRAELLQEAEALLEQPVRVQRTGLETWFHPPGGRAAVPPPRWKMWLVSVLAIYPLVLGFLTWISPHIAGWPLAVRAAILPLVLLSLMTYVVMPTVSRVLRRWLDSSNAVD
jgi:uncharacterized protein